MNLCYRLYRICGCLRAHFLSFTAQHPRPAGSCARFGWGRICRPENESTASSTPSTWFPASSQAANTAAATTNQERGASGGHPAVLVSPYGIPPYPLPVLFLPLPFYPNCSLLSMKNSNLLEQSDKWMCPVTAEEAQCPPHLGRCTSLLSGFHRSNSLLLVYPRSLRSLCVVLIRCGLNSISSVQPASAPATARVPISNARCCWGTRQHETGPCAIRVTHPSRQVRSPAASPLCLSSLLLCHHL